MLSLNTESNIPCPDDFYEALIEMHRDLSPEQSQAVNATLILLLANHIGTIEVLRDAMNRARDLWSGECQAAPDARALEPHLERE